MKFNHHVFALKAESQIMKAFLTDHVCLVTGGAQGIGWAISQALADHGAQVYACTFSEGSLERANQELTALPWPGRILLTQCDVTRQSQIQDWITNIHQQTGRIDVLVNNANYVTWGNMAEVSIQDAERCMRVGYDGMVYAVKAVLPLMLAAKRGHIVNLGSSAGRVFVKGVSAPYAAVKAAVNAFSQILYAELQGTPVSVTLVRPGTVAGTDFFRKNKASSHLPRLADRVPYITPPQVANSVIKAIRDKRAVVDVPGFLSLFYLMYDLAPGLLRRLSAAGGSAQKDYGQVEWRYTPKRPE